MNEGLGHSCMAGTTGCTAPVVQHLPDPAAVLVKVRLNVADHLLEVVEVLLFGAASFISSLLDRLD